MAMAQSSPASVSGVVRDESGTPVDSLVVINTQGARFEARTSAAGAFQFDGLKSGVYMVAPRDGLIMVAPQVRADSANRISTLAEARELGVVAVPLCLVHQYLLGQQGLAP
jgi:hypothetical protein